MKKLSYLLVMFAVLFIGTGAKFETTSLKKRDVKVIKVKNTTNFNIDMIYISPTEETHWGSDLLDADEILTPGEVVEIEVDCGTWDVKLVAEDESTCEISEINLCTSEQWNIVADCK